ncbi:MAG: stage 0 sporulation family protein [Ruminococcus sp.]|nr:stage 0 sporulation family protein [Ruminococcus sp.]
MKEIVGVRFKSVGKIYYFSPGNIRANVGDRAIVETVRGIECGEVVIANREIEDEMINSPLKPIIRLADDNDLKTLEKNKQREKDAFRICEEKIAARKLKMNLVDVECTFDNNKLLFYFTAENRVDFRELVKDLASVFRTRIELRQIGVRDEAKILGGLGICGREFCCKGYMGDFQPVSIKMAKEQGLSLNPTKISGTCGRLMCCLKNEHNVYEELLKITPKMGAIVVTPDGDKGKVEDVNLITGKLRVKTEKSEVPVTLDRSEVKLLKDVEIRVNREELKALKKLEEQ